MPRPQTLHCVKCERHISECGPLSARKKCDYCGAGEVIRNATGLANHDSAYMLRWRRGMARSIGAILPGDVSSDREA